MKVMTKIRPGTPIIRETETFERGDPLIVTYPRYMTLRVKNGKDSKESQFMTKIRPGTPIIRETETFERGDPLIVTLYPRYMTLRVKNGKDSIVIDYSTLLDVGRKITYRYGRRKTA